MYLLANKKRCMHLLSIYQSILSIYLPFYWLYVGIMNNKYIVKFKA